MKNILITGARSYVAWSMLKLARKQKKIKVFIGDSLKYSLSFMSGLYNEKILFSSPRYDFLNFKKDILDLVDKKNIQIIYPTCEEVFYFSKIKEELNRKGVEVFCDDFQKLKKLHSKIDFINYIKNINCGLVKIPKTKILFNLQEVYKYNNKKMIFKYEYSRFASNIYSNFGKFKNIYKLKKISQSNKLLAQEFINGQAICSFAIVKKGKLVSNISYKNIITYKGGSGTFFESYFDYRINQFVKNIVEKLNYNGFISFDFIDNGKNIYVLECNPRIVSGIHLFDNSKILSDLIYTEEKVKLFFPKKNKYKSLVLVNYLTNIRNIFKYKDAFKFKNDILKSEKKVFYSQIILYLYYLFKSLIYKKSISEITTSDIEFNG